MSSRPYARKPYLITDLDPEDAWASLERGQRIPLNEAVRSGFESYRQFETHAELAGMLNVWERERDRAGRPVPRLSPEEIDLQKKQDAKERFEQSLARKMSNEYPSGNVVSLDEAVRAWHRDYCRAHYAANREETRFRAAVLRYFAKNDPERLARYRACDREGKRDILQSMRDAGFVPPCRGDRRG
jgi:hypothetical protein